VARTFINQASQIGSSESFDDSKPLGSTLETNAQTVQDDLNALRSLVKGAVGGDHWYDAPVQSISALDGRVTAAEGDISTLESDLATETTARQSADTLLQSNIDSEASARVSADLVLQSNIDSEAVTRATNDTTLQSNIDAEAAARQGADLVLQSNIDNEASARAAADAGLDARLTVAESDIATLESDLSTEISARQSADTLLQSNIDAEASARAAADSAEASTRASADSTLQSNIDSEASARASADQLLQSNIDSEASARQAADGVLQTNIDNEASARSSADITLQSNIDAEASARSSADQGLQGAIDAEASTRAAADSSLSLALDTEAATRAAADSALDVRMTTAEADIVALESGLASETAARIAADAALQVGVDSKVAKAGDSMTGALSIDSAGALPALSITTAGQALSVADSVNGQFLLVDTSLQQMTFSDALGSGQVVVIDPAEVVVSHVDPQSNTQIAGTNVNAGQISLWMGGQPAMPASPEHVATKKYVDSLAIGLTLKAPVKAAGTLSAGVLPSASSPVDGVTLAKGERAFFFSADGSPSVDAGIWELEVTEAGGTSVSSWIRPSDYETGSDVSSTFFFVQQGQTYADTSWVEVADPAVVGTDALSFSQMFGPGAYLAGAGLDLVGNVFSIGQGEVVNSMIGDGEVSASKLASGSVTTAKIEDGAVTETKLGFDVTTPDELAAAMALKLSLSGGTMDQGAQVDFAGGSIIGLADLSGNSPDSAAANKKYVDEAVANLDARAGKSFSVLLVDVAINSAVSFSLGNIDAPLPAMPLNALEFNRQFDVFLNGQLQRPGANFDVQRALNNDQTLVFNMPLYTGDTLCVVSYT
jgi:hypothetical protein